MAVELVTKAGIPIARVGTYELASGPRTFTEEDLRAAADAYATDPAVKAPRVKIDSVEKALKLDPAAHGGEPSFGYFSALRVSADGQELLADFIGPKTVADAMEWAYLNLSIEGPAPGWISPTGRSHQLVVTAVALLGVHWPGITTLDDFTEFLAEGPKIEKTEAPEMVMATIGVAASLDQEMVARRLIDAIDTGGIDLPEGVRGYDLWLRSIRFDDQGAPYAKVTDEASGRLYRVDFKVSGSEVTFGQLTEVMEQDVPVTAGARPHVLAVWGSRAESRAVMAGTGGETGMTPEQIAALAAGYGLDPATATAESVIEAANAAAAARAAEEASSADTETETEAETVDEPVAAAAAERTRTVSAAQWDQTQSRLAAAEARLAERDQADQRTHRDGLIAAALRDGRIAPSERDQWRGDLDAAPDVTERILATLTPNRIPVVARGVDQQEGVNGGNADQQHEQFMAGFGGSRRAKRDVNGVTMISGAN